MPQHGGGGRWEGNLRGDGAAQEEEEEDAQRRQLLWLLKKLARTLAKLTKLKPGQPTGWINYPELVMHCLTERQWMTASSIAFRLHAYARTGEVLAAMHKCGLLIKLDRPQQDAGGAGAGGGARRGGSRLSSGAAAPAEDRYSINWPYVLVVAPLRLRRLQRLSNASGERSWTGKDCSSQVAQVEDDIAALQLLQLQYACSSRTCCAAYTLDKIGHLLVCDPPLNAEQRGALLVRGWPNMTAGTVFDARQGAPARAGAGDENTILRAVRCCAPGCAGIVVFADSKARSAWRDEALAQLLERQNGLEDLLLQTEACLDLLDNLHEQLLLAQRRDEAPDAQPQGLDEDEVTLADLARKLELFDRIMPRLPDVCRGDVGEPWGAG